MAAPLDASIQALYAAHAMTQNSIRPNKKRPRLCECGCGEKFTPKRSHQTFVSAEHRKDYWNRRYLAVTQKEFQFYVANRDWLRQVMQHRDAITKLLKRREHAKKTRNDKTEH